MTIYYYCFKPLIYVLVASILLTGCYSYYTIPKDEYDKVSTMEDIKIVYTNGKELVVEKNDTTYAVVIGDSLVVNKGSERKFMQMSEVEKIKERKFDLGSTVTLSLVALTILVVIFLSMDPFKT